MSRRRFGVSYGVPILVPRRRYARVRSGQRNPGSSRAVLHQVCPAPFWHALLDDLAACVPAAVIAARFHAGLVAALARMVDELRASGSRSVCGPTDTRC